MRDLYENPQKTFRFNPASFRHFTNGFYDSLITDYILRQKAENAIRVVSGTHDKLRVTLRTLENRREKLETSIRHLNRRKQEILLPEK